MDSSLTYRVDLADAEYLGTLSLEAGEQGT